MKRLVYDRAINIKLNASESVVVPENEVWKVFFTGLGGDRGISVKLEINGGQTANGDAYSLGMRDGNVINLGSGAKIVNLPRHDGAISITGIAFKVVEG